jgi:hypothetical protein
MLRRVSLRVAESVFTGNSRCRQFTVGWLVLSCIFEFEKNWGQYWGQLPAQWRFGWPVTDTSLWGRCVFRLQGQAIGAVTSRLRSWRPLLLRSLGLLLFCLLLGDVALR